MNSTENFKSPSLTYKKLIRYWLPLAASWLLMSMEGPFINGAISRLTEANLMIASFGIVLAIALTIESPVISLLATSTALARNPQHYRMLRRFTIHLMLLTTLGHALLGWTPLFNLVIEQWMNVPEALHSPILLGSRIMILWSAAIAYRRFMQGILIRFGETHYVSKGTLLRLFSAAGTAGVLAIFSDLPGVAVGTLALQAGVISEAIYAHWAAKGVIARKLGEHNSKESDEELRYMELVNFHWPLAASLLLFMLARPMISAALARSPNALLDLAAWPILSGLLFLVRAPAIALPEVIIALHDEEDASNKSGKFSLIIGLVLSLFMAVIAFTPIATFYFESLVGVEPDVAIIARQGLRYGVLLPLIMAGLSYYRGTLTATKNTIPITIGMVIELAIMGGMLMIGVTIKAPGVIFAAITMSVAMSSDILTLWISKKMTNRIQ